MEVGEKNRNGQIVIAKTDLPGTDFNSRIDILACAQCGYIYAANTTIHGSDFALSIKAALLATGIKLRPDTEQHANAPLRCRSRRVVPEWLMIN